MQAEAYLPLLQSLFLTKLLSLYVVSSHMPSLALPNKSRTAAMLARCPRVPDGRLRLLGCSAVNSRSARRFVCVPTAQSSAAMQSSRPQSALTSRLCLRQCFADFALSSVEDAALFR